MKQVQPRPYDLVEQPRQLLLVALECQCVVRVEYSEEVVGFKGETFTVDLFSFVGSKKFFISTYTPKKEKKKEKEVFCYHTSTVSGPVIV